MQGRPQEVYGAFAAFRQRRCRPLKPGDTPSEAPDATGAATAGKSGSSSSGGVKAVTATATAGSSGSSGSQLELMSRQAALADRLVFFGELLHILRPVLYALALRRSALKGAEGVGSGRSCLLPIWWQQLQGAGDDGSRCVCPSC